MNMTKKAIHGCQLHGAATRIYWNLKFSHLSYKDDEDHKEKMIAVNILIKSHLLDDIWLRCLNRALQAPSTLAND